MRYLYLILAFVIATIHPALAHNYTLDKQLKLADGLPNNGVTTLLKDSRGYIWIGTYDGLAQYAGNSFTIHSNSNTSQIFQSNRIRSLFEDCEGKIWVGTDYGVTIFDPYTYSFKNLEYNKTWKNECIIRSINCSQDKKAIYCLSESDGVLIYNLQGDLIQNLALDREAIFQSAIHIDEEKFLLASNNSILFYNFADNKQKYIFETDGGINNTGALERLDDTTILYGSRDGVRKITHPKKCLPNQIKITKFAQYTEHAVKTIKIDHKGNMWLGTDAFGVAILENAAQNWGKPLSQISDKMRISALLESTENSYYVATFDDGLLHYTKSKNIFKTFKIVSNSNDYAQRTLNAFSYDDDHILYHNSYQHIALFNIRTGEKEALPFKISDLQIQDLRYITKRQNGDIWLFMSNETEQWRLIFTPDNPNGRRIDDPYHPEIIYDFPYTICDDNQGNLWISNNTNTFRAKYDQDDNLKEFSSLNKNPRFQEKNIIGATSLYNDKHTNSLWIGTRTMGLFKLNFSKNTPIEEIEINHFEHNNIDPQSLSSNFVTAIFRAPDNTLWVSTEQGGVCQATENKGSISFTTFGVKNGLSSNSIKDIQCDTKGDLWFSTNYGLSKYDTKHQTFTSYQEKQGVPFDEFINGSLAMNGTLLFAAANNICYFDPTQIEQNEEAPNLYFTTLKLYDETIIPRQKYNKKVILDHTLQNGDTIELAHNENTITIGFDLLSNDMEYNHRVQYRINPISKKWTTISDSENAITLNGLRHGEYTFEIRTSDLLNSNYNSYHININIAPPFLLSAWGYAIYFALFIIFIAIILSVNTHIQRLRYRIRIEMMNKHNLEKLNSEKMRYFSNISHELKTPLALIMAPLSILKKQFSAGDDVSTKLNIIERQSDKILRLINLSLGLELNDSNLLKRKDETFSINEFFNTISADFEFSANYDNKIFTIEGADREIYVSADRQMVENITNNLVSNAFKYTQNGDTIKLSYLFDNKNLVIKVEDSGAGIDAADLTHLFDRLFRAKQRGVANVGGTGIGLYYTKVLVELHQGTINVESSVGQGTTFTVKLPIVERTEELQNHYIVATQSYNNQLLGELTLPKKRNNGEFSDAMVYIAEDNSEMRTLLTSIISELFCVKSFADGAECYEAMKTEWPDLVLSDVMMPNMDGYELCERLKSDIKTSHIPIILLTACATTIDDKIKGLEYGADAYISKPFHPNHIVTRIETLLSNRKRLRERYQINMPVVYGSSTNTRAKDNDFLEKLYRFFSENLNNEDLDVDVMVGEFGINRNLFYQKVKALTNSTPRELLNEYRLKTAADLIQSGTNNVNEVCSMIGYKSRTHFSKLFKERYGVSPSKYRKAE